MINIRTFKTAFCDGAPMLIALGVTIATYLSSARISSGISSLVPLALAGLVISIINRKPFVFNFGVSVAVSASTVFIYRDVAAELMLLVSAAWIVWGLATRTPLPWKHNPAVLFVGLFFFWATLAGIVNNDVFWNSDATWPPKSLAAASLALGLAWGCGGGRHRTLAYTAFALVVLSFFKVDGELHKNHIGSFEVIVFGMLMAIGTLPAVVLAAFSSAGIIIGQCGTAKIAICALWGMALIGSIFRKSKVVAIAIFFLAAVAACRFYPLMFHAVGKNETLTGRDRIWITTCDWTSLHPVFGNGQYFWANTGNAIRFNDGHFGAGGAHNALFEAGVLWGIPAMVFLAAFVVCSSLNTKRPLRTKLILLACVALMMSTDNLSYFGGAGICRAVFPWVAFCLALGYKKEAA